MYNYSQLKNTFCGISALGYAMEQGYKEITLVGFDALDPQLNNVGNVYEGTGFIIITKYTKEIQYLDSQRFSSYPYLKTTCSMM